MGIFKKDAERLENAFPAKPGKRFVSLFIDFILVFFVSYLFFLGGKEVAMNSKEYTENGAKVTEEVKYYATYSSESHAVEYLDLSADKPVRRETDALVLENVMRAIDHSYQVFGNAQEPLFVNDTSTVAHDFTHYGEASQQTDNVSYFYTQYLPLHNEGSKMVFLSGETYQEYLFGVYSDAFGTSSANFTYDATVSDIPVLKTESAYALYHYLVSSVSDTVFESGKSLYSVYYNAYETMLSDAESLLIRTEPYYTQHYLVYRNALYAQSHPLTYALIVSILLAYLVIVFLPKCLFGYGRSLGRLILGLGVITKDRHQPPFYWILLRSVCGAFGYLTVSILLYLLPPYSGVYDTMMMPLFGENFSYLLLLVLIAVLAIANGLPTLFTHYRQSLLDLLSKEAVVDKRNLEGEDFSASGNDLLSSS
jgi:uncharacterized RDD family membrane protein YckC